MANYTLRLATEADFPEIKSLIRQVRINPTKLDWRRFTVAISKPVPPASVTLRPGPDGTGKIQLSDGANLIGCAQLKPVPRDLTEMASLAVRPSYRNQGVARALIEQLLKDAPRPVYLTCRSSLGRLYEKFDFQALAVEEMPAYYRRLQRLAGIFLKFAGRDETLLVMKLG